MTNINWRERLNTTDFSVRNFINGEFVAASSSDELIHKHTPRNGELLYSFPKGSASDIDTAVANAREAFDDGRWRNMPLSARQAVFNKLADLIEAQRETFALYESMDVGKTITKALNDDMARVLGILRSTAAEASLLLAPSGADQGFFAYQRRKPVGVVGGIAGWNFPLTLAVSKMAPALIVGNSLVLKPSEFTSLASQHLAALAIEAGVPAGVFNVVHGAGSTVGAALVAHPDVDLISFVGSSATGRHIMASAGQSSMKRVILECGGKSPYMVFDDCPDDLDFIAQSVVGNAFPNQGALCVAGTRLLIQENMRDKLLPLIVEKAAAIKAQDPLDPESSFGALVNEDHMNKVLAYIDSGKAEGAKLLVGGERVFPEGNSEVAGGFYIEPTIFDEVDPKAKIAQEEIFGPVLSVVTFKDEAEAIQIANDSCFGLASYAATTDLARAQRLGERINAGLLIITGSAQPSGGGVSFSSDKHGQSGQGFSGGLEGLAAYTVSTTVLVMT